MTMTLTELIACLAVAFLLGCTVTSVLVVVWNDHVCQRKKCWLSYEYWRQG